MKLAENPPLAPGEREELGRMLKALGRVKEALRSFEDGEITLRTATRQIASAMSAHGAA